MSNIQIAITVRDTEAVVTGPVTLTSGMVGAAVAFSFEGSAWTGLEKIAVFQAGSVRRDVAQDDWADGVCTIPWECLQGADERLLVGVYGTDETGSVVIPTVYADCGWIRPGADPTGDPAADPTGPFFAPLLAQALAEASASGLFDGPAGEPGPKGEQGEPGEKGEPGGYTVLGMYATLSELETAHPTGSAGDAWFVGIPGSNVVYQWDVDREAWVNVGSLRGEKGATGATFTPSLASTGALSWTNNGGLANPATINIRGPRGPAGARGLEGKSAYEAAQEGGYEGTESEFNTALAEIANKAAKSTALTVTLPVAGWNATAKTQTVTASGVTAEDHLVITAAPASFVPYSQAGVRCSGQAADQLTFLCETIPAEELTVQVLVVG